jgi:hypothetical protein
MNFLITPPSTQYDGGLGITACHFSKAADILKENKNKMPDSLPLCYLQRHAIELFLKSFIVILHKRFKRKYGAPYSDKRPGLLINNKWKSLSNTHNLNDLYTHFFKTYEALKHKFPKTTDWDIEADINKKIKLVSGSDPKSTYFRYPEATNPAQDSKKSEIQRQSLGTMLQHNKDTNDPIKCVLMFNDNDELVDTYNIKSSPLPEVLKSLEELCEFFDAIHVAIRMELLNGS